MFSGKGGLHSVPFLGYIAPTGAETRAEINRKDDEKTMVMKKDRRKKDIKSKLMAAIAMLMVSSIMVASSSYAWFTLSTAPEVTGISTAIGANGNLEMALLPTGSTITEALGKVGNARGGQTPAEKNTTWGNLVDLSDNSYGLDQITLYPSTLALSSGKLTDYFLGNPKYGADGRFDGLNNTASTAIYNAGAFSTTGFGVRAVGTASGMGAHELAYRDALASANDAFNRAIAQTKSGAQQGGSALASLAVSKANNTTVYTQNDVNSLITAYEGIDTALTSIEVALKQYVIAYHLANGRLNDSTYLQELQIMETKELSELGTYAGETLSTYITALTTTKKTVKDNLAKLEGLTPTGTKDETVKAEDGSTSTVTVNTYTWDQFSKELSALADTDKMLLNGKTISYYMADNFAHIGDLTSDMSNLVLEVNASETSADSGLYAKLADFVDDYTTPVTISGVSYGGLTVNNLSVTMKVYATVDSAYLPTTKTAAMRYGPNAFAGGGSTLSDFYGYIIDMAFRTNAADSYLQLQTNAADRIYDNNANTDGYTMGHGSNMKYTVDAGSKFAVDKMVKLMSYIRVVFFDPTNNTILGYARLDASENAYTVTYVDTAATPDYNKGYTVSMDLKMWNPDVNDGNGAWASEQIVQLVQNQATAVSTLVYLDGAELTNADVANVELKGTMNIQFSSSAELVPMEYGDLLNGGGEQPAQYTVTINGIEVSDAKVEAGKSYTYTIPEQYSGYTFTVKMGDNDITDTAISGNVVNISKVTGNIVITATAPAPSGDATEPTN